MNIDGRELRNALGRFATGVCVVTTVDNNGNALGMTANSFSSVSLDPPLVLWSLQNGSDVYQAYASPRRFAINVLNDQQMDLSNQYARKGDHILDPAHFRQGRHGAPIIRGALVSFECELHAAHEGGDHLIIVGRVLDVSSKPGGDPLLFFSGAYRQLH
ncbi:flavin reductase [Seongchinamella sediminis]|uniref:Flavin reductase n=1 Tax=Seongchinamella sediminis TaxID=2283635 RepID=A0A3L7DV55_9GAMM|nr:flavin reductase family protein [Seongchinamella sediminis]RLQ20409.1 flavin reductase [Seongchinamella sediminis]